MACLHRKGVHCLIYKLQLHFYSLEIFVCTINNQDDVHNIYIYILPIICNTQENTYKNGNTYPLSFPIN